MAKQDALATARAAAHFVQYLSRLGRTEPQTFHSKGLRLDTLEQKAFIVRVSCTMHTSDAHACSPPWQSAKSKV
jgi:hypothetical protein